MKKLLGTVAGLAALCGVAFAQEYKATSLQTPVGKISFGAWGRSTFEIGQENVGTEITAKTTATGNAVVANATAAMAAYEVAGGTKLVTDDDFAVDFATKMAPVLGSAEAVGNALLAIQGAAVVQGMSGLATDTSDSDNFIRLSPDWAYGCRVGFWIIGRTDDEHFGFDFNLDSDARSLFVHKLWDANEEDEKVNYNEDGKYAVAIGDQAKMWALFDTKPVQFKVAFGKMRENVLRGSIGDFGQRESSDVKSEDDIFQEFWPTTGLFVSATGREDSFLNGFYTAACIDVAPKLGISNADTDRTGDGMTCGDVFQMGQYAVGYTIPGLMQIKAQYWGDNIKESNYRYATSKYKDARAAGFGGSDYYGRMEFGIDFLGLMGGATGLADLDLDKTPNAALIELGVKVPLVTDNDLRAYDPEKFYNFYSCLGVMGVIQKGFILYKGHLWGGQGVSNLGAYTDVTGSGTGLLTMNKGDDANIVMAGGDLLAEVCANPFGNQNLFIGLSGNYNVTSATADGDVTAMGNSLSVKDLKLAQHKFGAEVYVKRTFGSNNYIFGGVAYRGQLSSMEGEVSSVVDLSYKGYSHKVYAPIGIEMFF